MKISNISGIENCTGCMSCYNACPTNAIHIQCDTEGFLFPDINPAKCISCGQCLSVCPLHQKVPAVHPQEDCFAIMAGDEIRRKASSGGLFPLFAMDMLKRGGYVAGVVFDTEFQAKHIVSNQIEEVQKMFSSKYVQSMTGKIYTEVAELLKQGYPVLFSGCACQVAAMRAYLGEQKQENLFTIDVVCHGAPSPQVFQAYLAEEQKPIQEISFRDKQTFGWDVGLKVLFEDGSCKVNAGTKDPYMFLFLKNWILRKSCYHCQFKEMKYSDITLGDFWGINQHANFDDGLGTSFVTVNTIKGAEYIQRIRPQFKDLAAIQTTGAKMYNLCIDRSVPKNKYRKVFFQNWQKDSLIDSITKTKEQLHFDAALVLWWSQNYGNALTNYALYTWLEKQGLRVLALDNFNALRLSGIVEKFAREHYELSSQYFIDLDIESLNENCDCFIVGSDQSWNYHYQQLLHFGNYFYLDFVADDKKKISFASSFGSPDTAMPEEPGRTLLKRFDAIAVREEFAVDLCADRYHVAAKKVLDPVFLLQAEDYKKLAGQSEAQEKDPYILAYILDPNEKKRQLCLEFQKAYGGMKIIYMMDFNADPKNAEGIGADNENSKYRLPIEDWVYYMSHCQMLITDSFHGTCFAMIFGKKFVTVRSRETHRFTVFEKFVLLKDRILTENSEWHIREWMEEIDYEAIYPKLQEEIKASEDFLHSNLNT